MTDLHLPDSHLIHVVAERQSLGEARRSGRPVSGLIGHAIDAALQDLTEDGDRATENNTDLLFQDGVEGGVGGAIQIDRAFVDVGGSNRLGGCVHLGLLVGCGESGGRRFRFGGEPVG